MTEVIEATGAILDPLILATAVAEVFSAGAAVFCRPESGTSLLIDPSVVVMTRDISTVGDEARDELATGLRDLVMLESNRLLLEAENAVISGVWTFDEVAFSKVELETKFWETVMPENNEVDSGSLTGTEVEMAGVELSTRARGVVPLTGNEVLLAVEMDEI